MTQPLNTLEGMLVYRAMEASKRAYCPYSKFRVGAAIFTKNNSIHVGCNVENASYGLTNCAERTAIFNMIANTVSEDPLALRIATIVIYTPTATPTAPCGACRQAINEFADSTARIISVCDGKDVLYLTLADLLSHAFGPHNLGKEPPEAKVIHTIQMVETDEEEIEEPRCDLCHHRAKEHEPFTGCTRSSCGCKEFEPARPLCHRCDHKYSDHGVSVGCMGEDCTCAGYVLAEPCALGLDRCRWCLGHELKMNDPKYTHDCNFHAICKGQKCESLIGPVK